MLFYDVKCIILKLFIYKFNVIIIFYILNNCCNNNYLMLMFDCENN